MACTQKLMLEPIPRAVRVAEEAPSATLPTDPKNIT